MDDPLVIALFRHGMTPLNKKKAYLGWTDDPLLPEEKKRLSKLAVPAGYERIITSDLSRTMETACCLFPARQLTPLACFREMNFGIWEGKTFEELKGDPYYRKWLESPEFVTPPEGESFLSFSARVDQGWKILSTMISKEKVRQLAVVTHGGVIRYLLSAYAPEERDFWSWRIPHGSGYALVWDSITSFRRRQRCTLLREVPLTEKQHG